MESDIIFISVPTPSNQNGSVNLDIVNDVLAEISQIKKENKFDNIILLRSTGYPVLQENSKKNIVT